MALRSRLTTVQRRIDTVRSATWLDRFVGTLGRAPVA